MAITREATRRSGAGEEGRAFEHTEKGLAHVIDVHDVISDNFYVSMKSGLGEVEGVNPTVLLSILTQLVDGKALTFGNWGLGKTTLAEASIALTYGVPTTVTISSEAKGDSEVTKEEFIAMPNLSNMNEIIWRRFAQLPPKVIDEFNRLPHLKQAMFLDAIDRSNFEYMNQTLRASPGPIYATANWPDRGNVELLPAMRDRFDIATVAGSMNPLLEFTLEQRQFKNGELDNEEIAYRMLGVLDDHTKGYAAKIDELESLSEQFKADLSKRLGIVTLTASERKALNRHIRGIGLSTDAIWFKAFIRSESSCPDCGERMPDAKSAHKEGCHYEGSEVEYAFNTMTNHLSERFTKSLELYAKALSWFTTGPSGAPVVEPWHMKQVLPYVMWHRVGFSASFQSSQRNIAGMKVSDLDLAKEVGNGMFLRYEEQRRQISELNSAMVSEDEQALSALASASDHPLFKHAVKLLRSEE